MEQLEAALAILGILASPPKEEYYKAYPQPLMCCPQCQGVWASGTAEVHGKKCAYIMARDYFAKFPN